MSKCPLFERGDPENSLYGGTCVRLALEKKIEEERSFGQSHFKDMPKTDLFMARNNRANVLVQQMLQIKEEWKKLSPKEKSRETRIRDIKIERIKRVITTLYSDTFAVNTLLVLDGNQDILELTRQTQDLLKKQHQETTDSLKRYFQELNASLEKNFQNVNQGIRQVNEKLDRLHADLLSMQSEMSARLDNIDSKVSEMHEDMKKGFQRIENKLERIEIQVRSGFAHLDKKLDTEFKKINQHFQLLHQDLDEINRGIVELDRGLGDIKEQNKEFLRQNSAIFKELEKTNSLYAGYQKVPQPSEFQRAVGKTVSNAITVGLFAGACVFPAVGPIAGAAILKIGDPLIQWAGQTITEGAARLLRKIF